MSANYPNVLESRPSALTSNPQVEDDDVKNGTPDVPLTGTQARGIIRLIQCRKCSYPFREPVTLPCGRSLCKQCLPETHTRANISYPATANRLRGFQCPFTDCGKEHALGDCSIDVTLNKAISHVKGMIERDRDTTTGPDVYTHVITRGEWEVAGVGSLAEEETTSRVVKGGKLIALYTLAGMGELRYEVEVSFVKESRSEAQALAIDAALYFRLKESVRTEMDCQVCYALFYDPLTTVCGHTFCRSCLHRVLDHSFYCPVCRRSLSISPLLHRQSCPSNESLTRIINTFWADAVLTRGDALAAEAMNRHREFDIPIFVCTLSFPMMPTFLHIFEPRYRLMIRRALEGDRTFGMVLPQRPQTSEDPHFMEHGTLLRIVNAEYFADGRSLVESTGISRFRITRSGTLDGYLVGKIERVDDISIAEEEELEASEAQPSSNQGRVQSLPLSDEQGNRRMPLAIEDVVQMPTSELLAFGVAFVRRMQEQSVPWLARRILLIYGECPNDPVLFPWWFASILPARELEKYKLLETTSVRERLKICCAWIVEWEASR